MLEVFFATSLFVLGGVVFLYSRSFYDAQNFEVKETAKTKKSKTGGSDKRPVPPTIHDEIKQHQKAEVETIPSLGMEVDCVHLRTIDNVVTTPSKKSPVQSKLKAREHRPKVKETEYAQLDPVDFASEMQRRAREMNIKNDHHKASSAKKDRGIGKMSAPAIRVNKELISKSYAWTT
mmetsp:Transcript_17979/g.28136  ORF Transcript_17979/g.28136 Transcript_17979/m.28136 type:complete len:177 (-) Transcript_17979:60-590(-)|eukprot:CAMPEP_0201524190 /NCGR_PEP_ID=MMETSP0161_2-20130828/21167_1 /ASSEMBLY_ACC=CAM_ASM_000251 /TAXON_ID=180227 /ORGANISM="Neoparamoeba aestuarina, Strain SoJaBio B1-5/56/2" /LENGTH=176 /DNA_ID=CAMNT_0047923483 /DNA_START=22 /DNA_END=552 /DNA_ORIENTATION=-